MWFQGDPPAARLTGETLFLKTPLVFFKDLVELKLKEGQDEWMLFAGGKVQYDYLLKFIKARIYTVQELQYTFLS